MLKFVSVFAWAAANPGLVMHISWRLGKCGMLINGVRWMFWGPGMESGLSWSRKWRSGAFKNSLRAGERSLGSVWRERRTAQCIWLIVHSVPRTCCAVQTKWRQVSSPRPINLPASPRLSWADKKLIKPSAVSFITGCSARSRYLPLLRLLTPTRFSDVWGKKNWRLLTNSTHLSCPAPLLIRGHKWSTLQCFHAEGWSLLPIHFQDIQSHLHVQ